MAQAAAGAQGAPKGDHVVRGIAFAALGGICWGFSGTCAQLLTSGFGVPVSWITCVRLLLGALIFLATCLIREPRNLLAVMRDARSLLRIGAFALFGVLLTQVSYLSSISYTNAGTGTVLERLGLIVIMAFVCLRSRRLPKARELAGLVLAIAGTFLIATKGNFGALAIPAEGLFWGIVSAFALACYTLIPGKVLDKWGSFIVTGLAMLLGGSVATAVVHPWTIPVDVTPELALVMGSMVVIGTFAAYLFYLQGITDAGPVRAGLVGCVEPVSATAISAVWLGTPVAPVDLLGCALIIVMMFLVSQRGDQADAPADAYGGSTADLPPFEGKASLLGLYKARRATAADLEDMRAVIDEGHEALAQLGIDEGRAKYPSARRLRRAVAEGKAYVVTVREAAHEAADDAPAARRERVIGVFAVDPDGDAAYARSSGAQWLSDSSEPSEGEPAYAALHWVNVARDVRRHGVGRYILGTAERIAKDAGARSIRADIYEENGPMRALLVDGGYSACGSIVIRDRLGREKRRAVFERRW